MLAINGVKWYLRTPIRFFNLVPRSYGYLDFHEYPHRNEKARIAWYLKDDVESTWQKYSTFEYGSVTYAKFVDERKALVGRINEASISFNFF